MNKGDSFRKLRSDKNGEKYRLIKEKL